MSMDYVREAYGVPAKRGMRVRLASDPGGVVLGRVTSATHYVFVRWDGSGHHPWPYHPTDLVYLAEDGTELWPCRP